MKLKERCLALLLTAVMLLTFMPAMAFADDAQSQGSAAQASESATGQDAPGKAATPKSIEFVTADAGQPITGYIGSTTGNIYIPGNKVIITYSNKTKQTYICVEDEDGECDFHLNGKLSGKTLNELDCFTEDPIKEGDNKAVIEMGYSGGSVTAKVNVVGASDDEVKSVSLSKSSSVDVTWPYVMNNPDEWLYNEKNFKGDKITVVSETDGQTETMEYKYQVDPDDPEYYCFNYNEYDAEEDEYFVIYPEINFVSSVSPDRWLPGKSYEVAVYYHGVKAPETFNVNVSSKYIVPNEVIFTPAEGYEPSYFVGEKDVWFEAFTWEGCEGSSFTVKYSDGSEKKYIAVQHPKYEYYCYCLNGEIGKEEFDCMGEVEGGLVKGPNDVTFTYEKDISKADEFASVDFTITVNANRYALDIADKEYKYTGKEITPSFVVKNSVGKTLTAGTKATEEQPATGDYYVEYKPEKKIGIYTAQIVFNDGLEDRELYPESEEAYYRIIPPKAPVIKKVTGGKKSLTVKWTKFTKAQRKLIDGFYIEVATNKSFTSNYKMIKVSKTASSKTIKGLKKGKKYYVKMFAYKNVKPEGANRKFPVYSKDSKRKYAKTK